MDIVVPDVVAFDIVAATVTVTDSPGSRQDTLTVTNCPTVELLVVNDVPPAHVSTPDVPCVLVTLTAPSVRLALNVSVNTISNAVADAFPLSILLNSNV